MWSVSLRRACKDDGGDHRSQLPCQGQPEHAADRPRQAQLRKFAHKLHKAQGRPSCRLTHGYHSMKKLVMPALAKACAAPCAPHMRAPLGHHPSRLAFPSLQMCES